MTKKQERLAKELLKDIEKAETMEVRSEAVRTYSVFMNEMREQANYRELKLRLVTLESTRAIGESFRTAVAASTTDIEKPEEPTL